MSVCLSSVWNVGKHKVWEVDDLSEEPSREIQFRAALNTVFFKQSALIMGMNGSQLEVDMRYRLGIGSAATKLMTTRYQRSGRMTPSQNCARDVLLIADRISISQYQRRWNRLCCSQCHQILSCSSIRDYLTQIKLLP